ncbi:hypothetical protein ABIB99_002054 [Bradyrhizobium sp. LA6.1]|uniref:hypothetical protein n=1 Tax=Bradyrhizobium sp. LA6.1 TaxID=3156378 RepID=UPI003394F408
MMNDRRLPPFRDPFAFLRQLDAEKKNPLPPRTKQKKPKPQVVDPLELLRQGDAFFKVELLLRRPMMLHQDVDIAVVRVVTSAFANEMYLKCIAQIEKPTQPPPQSHDLEDLFGALSLESQEYIEIAVQVSGQAIFGAVIPEDPNAPKTFRQALRGGAEAFVQWRYRHENRNFVQGYYLFRWGATLRERALQLRPDWVTSGTVKQRVDPPSD